MLFITSSAQQSHHHPDSQRPTSAQYPPRFEHSTPSHSPLVLISFDNLLAAAYSFLCYISVSIFQQPTVPAPPLSSTTYLLSVFYLPPNNFAFVPLIRSPSSLSDVQPLHFPAPAAPGRSPHLNGRQRGRVTRVRLTVKLATLAEVTEYSTPALNECLAGAGPTPLRGWQLVATAITATAPCPTPQ